MNSQLFHRTTLLFIFFALIVGLGMGLLIGEIPFTNLKIVPKVRVSNIIAIVITASAILAAPFITKRLIEDNRVLKDTLLAELNAFLEALNDLHFQIQDNYQAGGITDSKKHQLFRRFDKSDRNIHSLATLVDNNCSENTKALMNELQDRYIAYWEFITSEELSQFTDETHNTEIEMSNSVSSAATDLKSNIVGL